MSLPDEGEIVVCLCLDGTNLPAVGNGLPPRRRPLMESDVIQY